ncbi:hypothetical protein QZH41_001161 [Actinostola sp. cb2023]|nr:hypothetical protein QZH41_001161 [Actinostola sp. cb2023]
MHDLQADTQLESMVQQIPDDDPEVRPQVQVLATEVGSKQADLGTGRFTRFSGWPSLVRAVSKIITVARLWHKDTNVQTQKTSSKARTMEKASITIFRNIQQESYKEEMQCLSTGKKLPRNSTLLKLNPTISADGLLVVGGRLDKPQTSLMKSVIQLSFQALITPPSCWSSIYTQRYSTKDDTLPSA